MEDGARTILHIDLDSYYTQVEMKRLNIPRETPCAVQQWEGLIAVNYPARAKGITRHMRVKEAQKVCPELVLVHVETIGADGSSDDAEAAAAAAAAAGGEGAGEGGAAAGGAAAAAGGGGAGQEKRRLTQKACLERYRRSTAEVLALLHKEAPGAVIEKASIDEVYMDVTAMVDKELQGRPAAAVDAFAWGSVVVGGPLDVSSEFERRLAAGAGISCRLRGALLRDLGYTASAGIACNKLLAKLGSAMHKPNQQTVIPPRSALQVMQDLPLSKLRGFGGKLGEQLQELGCSTAGQVQQLPHATLAARFGEERAAAIEQAVRGISSEPVQERERPKSMLAAKSFNPTSDLGALSRWFGILAQELANRMATDEAEFRRRPRNLVVHYRGGAHPASERSKSCPMPRLPPGGNHAEIIAAAGLQLFKSKCAVDSLPCNRLALSAADFADLPATGGAAITRFLVPKSQLQPAPAQAADGSPAAAGGSSGGPASAAAGAGGSKGSGGGRAGAAAGAGPSISSLFERAQKRQRVEQAQQQQQQQQEQQTIKEEQQQQAEEELAQSKHEGGQHQAAQPAAGTSSGRHVAGTADETVAGQADESPDLAGQAAVDGAAAAAAGADGAGAAEAADSDAAVLAGVDVEEQKRILKDIALLQRLQQGRPASVGGKGGGGVGRGRGGGRGGGKQQGSRQPGISAFFSKQP